MNTISFQKFYVLILTNSKQTNVRKNKNKKTERL